jgi:hypothetical protein
MKFGRAIFNTVVTSCVWAFRMIIPWASSAPSVANVIAAFAFAALTRIKGTYSRESGEPNRLPSRDAGKLSAVAAWRK